MEYRRLGRTGLLVSEMCMGTMTFGAATDEEEARKMFGVCLERGVNFFDTANVYAGSRSEQILGRIIQGHREDLVIATKVFNPMGKGPNDIGLSRKHIMRACDDSLKRLGTDYIDLYQVHGDDRWTPLEETLRALDDLVRAGKVRYIGASNYGAWRLSEALWTSETRNLARYDCLQPLYNLVERGLDAEVLPLCRDKGVGVIAWSPLGGGFLTGKYRAEAPEGSRLKGSAGKGMANMGAPNREEILDAVLKLASELDRSPAQVALRWVMDQEGLTSAIVGARNVAQLEDNLGAADLELSRDAWKSLDRLSRPPIVYPAGIDRFMTGRRKAQLERGGKA